MSRRRTSGEGGGGAARGTLFSSVPTATLQRPSPSGWLTVTAAWLTVTAGVAHRGDGVAHRDNEVARSDDGVAHRDNGVAHRDDEVAHRDNGVAHQRDYGRGRVRDRNGSAPRASVLVSSASSFFDTGPSSGWRHACVSTGRAFGSQNALRSIVL